MNGEATDTYIGIMKRAEARSGIKMLTPEYEVTAMLFDVGLVTPLELQQQFSGSGANFFKILKSLVAKDVIVSEPNPLDGRSKLYRLSDRVMSIMAEQWSRYDEAGRDNLYASSDPSEAIHQYTRIVTRRLKVKQFTCEFQILLYLSASPGLTNVKFNHLVDVSEAKFNLSLAALKKSGHVIFEKDRSDKRSKLYYLSERERKQFDETDKRIFDWLDSKSEWLAAKQLERR